MHRTLTTLISTSVCCTPLFAQATVDPNARDVAAGIPLPAAQRDIQPDPDAWWQNTVFYELFVRSFADSTTGPLADDGVGDFAGLMDRLDHLNDGDPSTDDDLGITGIWLMPIMQSPSYHGYDTADYRMIDDEYGTNEDFIRFMDECHQRGIRVIIDLVLNHCSSRHAWFEASTDPASDKRDWFIWEDANPGFKGPWNQRVWHRSPNRDGTWFYGMFVGFMPDLNYLNTDVSREMTDVATWWLTDMNADGFRLDAIRHLIEVGQLQDSAPPTFTWLRDFNAACKAAKPDMVSVGEVWSPSDVVSRYVGDGMDLAFEFDLADAIVNTVKRADADTLHTHMRRIDNLYPVGMYASFLRNHDQPRVRTVLEGDLNACRAAAFVQLCLPGVPFIYYGEEIGMQAAKPDPSIRTPMQWTANAENAGFSRVRPWAPPKPDVAQGINVAMQTDEPASLLSLYRRLIRLRAAQRALRVGEYVPINTTVPSLLAFARATDDERVVCVINLANKRADVSLQVGGIVRQAAPVREILHNLEVGEWDGIGPWSPVEHLDPHQGVIITIDNEPDPLTPLPPGGVPAKPGGRAGHQVPQQTHQPKRNNPG